MHKRSMPPSHYHYCKASYAMMSTTPYFVPRAIDPHQSQQGFTLIELMISMVIGLIVLLAITTLFVNVNRNNSEFAKTNILIENGRFAVQLLETDLIHTGFWGGHVPDFDNLTASTTIAPTDVPTGVPLLSDIPPDPCLVYSTANWDATYQTNLLGIAVQAYDAASVCAPLLTNILANTDVLIVRHADTCVPGDANCDANVAGRLYFQQSNCTTDASPYVLNTAGFTLNDRDCATTAGLRKFISNIYYIRDFATTVGDGTPTLMRSEFNLVGGVLAHQAAVPLIEGIEGFRVELGIDNVSRTGAAVDYTAGVGWTDITNKTTPTNRGDGATDGVFVRCTTATPCTAAQLMNVVTVKLHVLARAPELTQGYTDTKTYSLGTTTLGPFNDMFKRHIFSTTVRLQNISGRRETPAL